MSLIIHWVTQIIVFLLLATIIDLLVPTNSMKKYIQFAVGLILILIFLKPVFYLFQIDMKQAIQTTFQEQQHEIFEKDALKNNLEIKKSEIESSEHAYILEQMAVQLKNLANKPLGEEFQQEIADIDFQFKEGASQSYENLDKVIVYLQEKRGREGNVDAVNDVEIGAKQTEAPKKGQDDEAIAELLQQIWELDGKKLILHWEGGST